MGQFGVTDTRAAERPLREAVARVRATAIVCHALLVFAACGCAGSQLARLYPRGEPRSAITSPSESHSGTIDELPSDIGESAKATTIMEGDSRRAASFTAYTTTVTVGGGYGRSVRYYCDYVVFDTDGLVLGAYRRQGAC